MSHLNSINLLVLQLNARLFLLCLMSLQHHLQNMKSHLQLISLLDHQHLHQLIIILQCMKSKPLLISHLHQFMIILPLLINSPLLHMNLLNQFCQSPPACISHPNSSL